MTEKGVKNWQKVVDLAFYYISEVMGKFTEKYINKLHEQLREISELSFDYQDLDVSLEEVMLIASKM